MKISQCAHSIALAQNIIEVNKRDATKVVHRAYAPILFWVDAN